MTTKGSPASRIAQSGQGALEISTDSQADAEGNAGKFGAVPSVQAWCSRLGMLPEAVEQWALWHTNPAIAITWFFTAEYEI
jgi:hypothetical protein